MDRKSVTFNPWPETIICLYGQKILQTVYHDSNILVIDKFTTIEWQRGQWFFFLFKIIYQEGVVWNDEKEEPRGRTNQQTNNLGAFVALTKR
jgi:hypothetical protein